MPENDGPINDPSEIEALAAQRDALAFTCSGYSYVIDELIDEIEKLIGYMKTGSNPYLLDLCGLLGLGVVASWEDAFDELKLRLMPKGMEWPRYEGGEPVLITDEADGIRVDEVRFGVGDIGGCTIFQVGPDGLNERVRPVEFGERLKRPDSWERLEEDATKQPYAYCVGHGLDDDSLPTNEKFARDLVRRAKALAERGA